MSYILTAASYILCPHGGRLRHFPTAADILLIEGQRIYLHDDLYSIIGCPNDCLTVKWSIYYDHLTFHGKKYPLTNQSLAECMNFEGSFRGYAVMLFYQMRIDTETLIKSLLKESK